TGSLAVRTTGNKVQVYLSNLKGQVYEKHAVYYPASNSVAVIMPGERPGSRPPYMYVKVTELPLFATSRDLLQLVQLMGLTAPLTVSGPYGHFERPEFRPGLTVETVTVRNQTVPANLPSQARSFTLAKQSLQSFVASRHQTVQGAITATN